MMNSDEFYMRETINFAKERNDCWPFAALIVDNDTGRILVKAVDSKHISPTLNAESHAIHRLALKYDYREFKSLSLYSNAESEMLSYGAIISAIITGYNIDRLVYGANQKDICDLWGFKHIDVSHLINRIQARGGVLKEECMELFKQAKVLQEEINDPHPGKVYLSKDLDSFYEVN